MNTEPATNGADNVKTLALAFLAYESARQGMALDTQGLRVKH